MVSYSKNILSTFTQLKLTLTLIYLYVHVYYDSYILV